MVTCSRLQPLSRLCRTSPAPWDPNLWALLIKNHGLGSWDAGGGHNRLSGAGRNRQKNYDFAQGKDNTCQRDGCDHMNGMCMSRRIGVVFLMTWKIQHDFRSIYIHPSNRFFCTVYPHDDRGRAGVHRSGLWVRGKRGYTLNWSPANEFTHRSECFVTLACKENVMKIRRGRTAPHPRLMLIKSWHHSIEMLRRSQ